MISTCAGTSQKFWQLTLLSSQKISPFKLIMQIGTLRQSKKLGQNSETYEVIEMCKKSIMYLALITSSNFLW